VKLLGFHDAISKLQFDRLEGPTLEANLEIAREKRLAFLEFFGPNRIYIPKPTADKVMEFYQALYSTTVVAITPSQGGPDGSSLNKADELTKRATRLTPRAH